MVKVLVAREATSPLAEVDAVPVWRELHPGEYVPGAWWGVPVWVVREWVRDALRRGAYREAGLWSAALVRG